MSVIDMENITPKDLAKLVAMPKFQALIAKASISTIKNSTETSVNAHKGTDTSINTNASSSVNVENNTLNLEPFIVEYI